MLNVRMTISDARHDQLADHQPGAGWSALRDFLRPFHSGRLRPIVLAVRWHLVQDHPVSGGGDGLRQCLHAGAHVLRPLLGRCPPHHVHFNPDQGQHVLGHHRRLARHSHRLRPTSAGPRSSQFPTIWLILDSIILIIVTPMNPENLSSCWLITISVNGVLRGSNGETGLINTLFSSEGAAN